MSSPKRPRRRRNSAAPRPTGEQGTDGSDGLVLTSRQKGTGDGPIRTCVGCRTRRPQAELTRIGRRADGSLAIGRTLPGRGAWLCARSLECLKLAVRRQAFTRALRAPVDAEAIQRLQTDFVRSASAVED